MFFKGDTSSSDLSFKSRREPGGVAYYIGIFVVTAVFMNMFTDKIKQGGNFLVCVSLSTYIKGKNKKLVPLNFFTIYL